MSSNSDPLDGAISTIARLALSVPSYEWGARPAPGLRVAARVSKSERCVVIPSQSLFCGDAGALFLFHFHYSSVDWKSARTWEKQSVSTGESII